MPDSAVVDKIIVDIQTRAIHLVSDEGEFKTLDCSDDYEAFMKLRWRSARTTAKSIWSTVNPQISLNLTKTDFLLLKSRKKKLRQFLTL